MKTSQVENVTLGSIEMWNTSIQEAHKGLIEGDHKESKKFSIYLLECMIPLYDWKFSDPHNNFISFIPSTICSSLWFYNVCGGNHLVLGQSSIGLSGFPFWHYQPDPCTCLSIKRFPQ